MTIRRSSARPCGRDIANLSFAAVFLLLFAVSACSGEEPAPVAPENGRLVMMTVTSDAFAGGEEIPVEYTCDGEDRSPHVAWSDPPVGTQALVVIVDDPDAPGRSFNHWLVYNLPPDLRSLSAGQQQSERLDNGALQGRNDFGQLGYDGPCPPEGPAHEYVFFIYALDEELSLSPGAARADVVDAMRMHVIGVGQMSGIYARR